MNATACTMSSAFPFPVTPRKKRAVSGVEVKLYDPLTTPIRFRESQNTPDSHSVPELDWGLSPETGDQLPATPASISSPGELCIKTRRPLKQLRRSSRIQAQKASDCANPEGTSKDAGPVFSPSIYSLVPSLPRTPDFNIVHGDISWRNATFFELSRAPSSNITTSSTSATQRLSYSRRVIGSNTVEPSPKRSKEKAEPLEENHPSFGITKILSPTVVQVLKAPTTEETPAYLKKETKLAFTGVTSRRFSRILPLKTVERVWEDEQRCVASLVARPDIRCSALVSSSKDVKNWICNQLSQVQAASDLGASEGYIRELLSFTTCTTHHRSIAEQQLDRLLNCYHDRRSQYAKSKHNFTKRDVKAVQYWLTALTSLIDTADYAAAERRQQTRILPVGTPHVPAAIQDRSEFPPSPERILQTLAPEEALVNKVLRKDAHAQPQALIKPWNRVSQFCTVSFFDQLLSVLRIDPQRSTCIGKTKTGVLCTIAVAKTSREQALGLLRTFSDSLSISTLGQVSGLLLCKRWHQNQAVVISSEWAQNCKTVCMDQKFHTNETVQEYQHNVESTSSSHKESFCEYVRVKHSHDDSGCDKEINIITSITDKRRDGAVRRFEDAQNVNKSNQIFEETVSTTKIAATVETSRILTSSSKRIKTGTFVETAELRQISTWSQTSPTAQVASTKVQSKLVLQQQGLKIVVPSMKLREASLVALHQRFSWYMPGKSGFTSIEALLHERLNMELTPQEYQKPLTDIKQPLKYPSQSLNYPGQGLIYLYWIPGNFGFVKIGKTSGESTERRLKEWRDVCGHPLEEYTRGQTGLTLQLPHAYRVERLVHTELKDYRIREDRCESTKCGKSHIEWFCVPQNHALKVIEKWSSWIKTRPYIEVNGIWRLKESINVDDILCKPIELPTWNRAVLPAFPRRQHVQTKYEH